MFEDALKWLKLGAEKDAKAMYYLANWYNNGDKFLEVDTKRALELYKKAAYKGHLVAAHNCACAYLIGRGCEQPSPKGALAYFRLASDGGYVPSKMNLARIFVEGEIVPKDPETAKILYKEIIASNLDQSKEFIAKAKELLAELELQ